MTDENQNSTIKIRYLTQNGNSLAFNFPEATLLKHGWNRRTPIVAEIKDNEITLRKV